MLWTLVGTALGLGLLYASLRQVDAAALVGALRSVNWLWVSLVPVATLAFCALKAWRWTLLLGFMPVERFKAIHAAVYQGLAVNFLVAHVGEFFRAVTVARAHGARLGPVLASVVVERTLDFIALLVLLELTALLVPQPPQVVTAAATFSAAFLGLAVAGLYALLHPPAWAMRLAAALDRSRFAGLAARIGRQLGRFRLGLESLRSPRLMLLAILASVLQWSLVVLAIWCCALAVGKSTTLLAVIVTFVLIVAGLALPNSPLQIGTTQFAFVLGLGTDGDGATTAIAASLVYTAFLIVPIMLVGGALMLRSPAALTDLREERDTAV